MSQQHEPEEPRLPARFLGRTVRRRLLVLITLMLGLTLLLTGVLTFAVQYATVSERVDRDLEQEIGELTLLAQSGPARDGPPYDNAADLFLDFMNVAVAGEDEAFLGMLEGEQPIYSGGTGRSFNPIDPEIIETVDALDVADGRARTATLRTQGTTLRMIVADVQLPGETRDARFVVLNDFGSQRALVNRQVMTYAGVSLLMLLAGGAAAHLVLGRLLRPLQALREATARIHPEDLSMRVDVNSAENTDVAELAIRFNQMLDRIEDGVRQQRQFLDDAAHELRTPLTILRGNTELLQADDPEDVATTRVLLLDELDRMQRLVDDLLILARAQRPDFIRRSPTELAELAVECMDRMTNLGERQWRLTADAEGEVLVDRQRLIQALLQLAANAVKFSEPGSKVELATALVPQDDPRVLDAIAAGAAEAPEYITLSITDQGRGIPESQLERVFDRFGRGENSVNTEGSGLGLAIVKAIVEAHGGAVIVKSTEGIGSRFTLWLPTDPPEEPPHSDVA
ncbi:sensor histidine kinase [Ornithinimicrobium pratense]|uniref:histidine kinase n=1 Tax=Ornithinimicrobium pratense TaxID=2593973 RepID=A0A5J6V810_9MICO|nr:ATP-binding protein [Ornithinimicrobium pratense]QFG69707.1 HAMP domain-containing protein [Ornithinimicrobium pratense]